MFSFVAVLFAAPALAKGHAGEECDMASTHSSDSAHHVHGAPAVPEIPQGAAASSGGAPCPLHGGIHTAHCNSQKMLHCDMGGGCCIKSGGPLSTGPNEKSAGQEDNVFVAAAAQLDIDGRSFTFAESGFLKIQINLSPIPRPPSA